jgi:hypothetical protein
MTGTSPLTGIVPPLYHHTLAEREQKAGRGELHDLNAAFGVLCNV